MKDILKISVITPSYNSDRYLEDAVLSVLSQDYANFEHIIVDGGSEDNTLEILNKYSHLKWISEPDKGQSDAMNKGFMMSTGDIIVYLNADDYFLPNAFHRVIPYFLNGAKFVVGTVRVTLENGSSWLNNPKVSHLNMLRHWESNAFCVNPVGYFYLREVQQNSNGFSLDNHLAMDLEFLLECSSKYEFTKMQDLEPLGVFRYYSNTKTAKSLGSDDNPYTFEKFNFIDKFLADKSEIFRSKYTRKRKKAYKRLNRQLHLKNIYPIYFIFKFFRINFLKFRDFTRSDNKSAIIRDFINRNIKNL